MGTYCLYISSFIISAFTAVQVARSDNRKDINNVQEKSILKKVFVILLISIVPVFLASIRNGIGIDYSTYELVFNRYKDVPIGGYFQSNFVYEIGNFLIIKLGYFIFHDVQGIFALYAVFTICLLVAAVMYYEKRISVFIAIMIMYLLYYSGSLNTIRQYLAIAIVSFAYRFIEERKLVKYLIAILIATSVHSTAIIMVFVYFLYVKETDIGKNIGIKKHLVRIAVVLLVLSPVIISGMMSSIANIPIFSRYFDVYEITRINITTSFILKLPVYIPLILAYKKNINVDSKNKFYYILLLLEFELLVTSIYIKWGFRLSYYAFLGQVILVAHTIKNEKLRSNRIIKGCYFVAWYLIQFWLLYFVWGRDAITPFTHIFF